jgi:hypothetical protein
LRATLVNNTGSNANALDISYDFTNTTTVAEQVRGYRVYCSLSGAAGSWEKDTEGGWIFVTASAGSLTGAKGSVHSPVHSVIAL